MTRIIPSIVVLALLFANTSMVFAQDGDANEIVASSSEESVQGTVQSRVTSNCFDYYNFESIQITVQSDFPQTVSGEEMRFSGEIENRNTFPIVSGALVAKVFLIDETLYESAELFEFVDEFVVEGNLTLPPGAKRAFSHEWTVPSNAKGGKYFIAYSFSQVGQYNFLGQSYSEAVVGKTVLFDVTGDNEEGVVGFDKLSTTVDGSKYSFTESLTTVPAEGDVVIKTSVTNPTKQTKTVPFQWNQYAWDAAAEKNRRNTQTELVTLAPGETKELSYKVAEQAEAMVYVTATVSDLDTKNILAVRFVKEGVLTPRLVFSGLSGFPLKAGEKQKVALCAQTALGTIENTSVHFSLRSADGTVIHEFSQATNINEFVNGFVSEFTPGGDFEDVTLTATLKQGDTVLDEVALHYGCAAISEEHCASAVTELSENVFNIFKSPLFIYSGAAVLILLLLLAWSMYRRRKKRLLRINGYEMTQPE